MAEPRRSKACFEAYGFLALRAGPLRLTGGGYVFVFGRHDAQAGPSLTGEVKVAPHLLLAAEWHRHHDLGMGLVAPLGSGVTLYVAYLLSPSGRDHDGVIFEIGFLF